MAMMGDEITMKEGKVMLVSHGETVPLEEDVTMADGTRVMRNGQVLMANGTARMLREGETITLDREPTEPEEMSDRQFKEAREDEELRDELH